jgi:hypothetical protein
MAATAAIHPTRNSLRSAKGAWESSGVGEAT